MQDNETHFFIVKILSEEFYDFYFVISGKRLIWSDTMMHPLQAISKLVLVRSLSDLTRLKNREHLGLFQFFKLQSIRANLKYKFKVLAPENVFKINILLNRGTPTEFWCENKEWAHLPVQSENNSHGGSETSLGCIGFKTLLWPPGGTKLCCFIIWCRICSSEKKLSTLVLDDLGYVHKHNFTQNGLIYKNKTTILKAQ